MDETTSTPDDNSRSIADLESFDLNLLRVLDALLITGSVSGAARRLRLSQPATSGALARLREILRDPLLVRDGNKMVPTPLADELRPRVVRILEDVGATLNAVLAFDPATTERRFRVGANDYAAFVLLIPLAARVRELAPRAMLEIFPIGDSPDTALANREVDAVLADCWDERELRRYESLFRETFVSIVRKDHPRIAKPTVTLDEYLAEDHALISPRGRLTGVVDHALDALGRSRRVALTLPHYLVAPAVVAETDLVMTLPRRIAESALHGDRLRIFQPPVELDGFDVVLATHPRSRSEPPVQWLAKIIREVASNLRTSARNAPAN